MILKEKQIQKRFYKLEATLENVGLLEGQNGVYNILEDKFFYYLTTSCNVGGLFHGFLFKEDYDDCTACEIFQEFAGGSFEEALTLQEVAEREERELEAISLCTGDTER